MEDNIQLINELKVLIERTSSDLSAIALIDQSNRITWKYIYGNINDRYRNMVMRPGFGIAGQVFRLGRSIVIDQAHITSDQTRMQFPIMLSEQLLAVITAPLYIDDRVVGVLLIGNRQQRTYSMQDIQQAKQASEGIIDQMSKSYALEK